MSATKPYADPSHPDNSASHHTGKRCIEKGCSNPAGTAWSPYWCQPCNAKRLRRVSNSLRSMLVELETRKLAKIDQKEQT